MIYLEEAKTQEQAAYNFRIWKLVYMLYKLKCISIETVEEHAGVVECSFPLGLRVDLEKFTLAGANIIQF